MTESGTVHYRPIWFPYGLVGTSRVNYSVRKYQMKRTGIYSSSSFSPHERWMFFLCGTSWNSKLPNGILFSEVISYKPTILEIIGCVIEINSTVGEAVWREVVRKQKVSITNRNQIDIFGRCSKVQNRKTNKCMLKYLAATEVSNSSRIYNLIQKFGISSLYTKGHSWQLET